MKRDSMLTSVTKFLFYLPEDMVRKYIAALISITLLGLSSGIYYIHTQTSLHIKSITQARALASKTDELISSYNAVTQEEDNLADLLNKKTDYSNLNSYFERFCQDRKITPESGWAETTEIKEISGSDRFEEEQLTANFKKITLKEAICTIDAIERDELLHLKEVVLDKSDGSLSIKMTLAAKRFKRTVEE